VWRCAILLGALCAACGSRRPASAVGPADAAVDAQPPKDAIAGADARGCDWDVETLERGYGWATSLAIDSTGTLHAAYTAIAGLRYAFHDGTAWSFESVAPEAYVNDVALEVDRDGGVHVAYYVYSPTSELRYTRRDPSGTWSAYEVVREPGVGIGVSLAVDAAGRVHVAYMADYGGRMEHAVRLLGGTWEVQTIADRGGETSIAIDATGRLHLAYGTWIEGGLHYAERGPADRSWTFQYVDPEEGVGRMPSLELDRVGGVHVSYHYEGGGVRYAWLPPGGQWTWEAVHSTDVWAYATSLALDARGGVHVCSAAEGARYSYRPEGGSWRHEAIDAGDAFTGEGCSLAIDPREDVHVTYRWHGEGTNEYEVRHARRCGVDP